MNNENHFSRRLHAAAAKAIKYFTQHPLEWKTPDTTNENHFNLNTLKAFNKAINYINKHPLEWKSPHALSCYIRINQSTLQAVFLHKTGRTISEYWETVRITVACSLLADETLSTKEIATLCGYSSQSSFNKAFKRVKGISPGKWAINGNHPP